MKYNRLYLVVAFFLFLSSGYSSLAIGQDENNFSFAVMGCLHMGVSDPQRCEKTIKKIEQAHPDLVVFTGGMVDPYSGKRPVKALWEGFDRITAELGIPVYNVPDSCKLTPLGLSKEKQDQMDRCFNQRYKKRYSSFEYKNNLFILLDSDNLIEDSSNASSVNRQLKFLEQLIKGAAKYDNVFVFFNRAFWLEGKGMESRWFKNIHPILKDRVRFVFAANGHCLDMSKVDNVTYLNNGCPSPGNSPMSFSNFLLVNVTKNGAEAKICPAEPLSIDIIEDHKGLSPKNWAAVKDVKNYALTAPERTDILSPERIVQTLGIKPDMSIVDIGAGTGLFAFLMSKELKGTGRVFATEINPDMIEYMDSKKKTDPAFINISPVLVSRDSLDRFYTEHQFDIIFLGETYHCFSNPKEYFMKLRPSLKKDGGRLYIIHFKIVSDFSKVEFGDFKEIINVLSENSENHPILARFSDKIRDFIKNNRRQTVPAEIKEEIVAGLNRMLLDRDLCNDLLNYYSSQEAYSRLYWGEPLLKVIKNDSFRKLTQWLVINLSADGVFDPKVRNISERDMKDLRYLNRILISGIFHSDILNYIQAKAPFYLEKSSIIGTLDDVGYQFVREYEFLPHHYFLEFKLKTE